MTLEEAVTYLTGVSVSLPADDVVAEFVKAVLAVAEEVKKLKETP